MNDGVDLCRKLVTLGEDIASSPMPVYDPPIYENSRCLMQYKANPTVQSYIRSLLCTLRISYDRTFFMRWPYSL